MSVHGRFDEARIAPHVQVLRDGELADTQALDELSDGPRAGTQGVEELAAVGLGEDYEDDVGHLTTE